MTDSADRVELLLTYDVSMVAPDGRPGWLVNGRAPTSAESELLLGITLADLDAAQNLIVNDLEMERTGTLAAFREVLALTRAFAADMTRFLEGIDGGTGV